MRSVCLAFLMLAWWVAPAAAEGMKVEPGLWEIRSVATLPMSTEPQVDTRRECMERDRVDPEEFLADLPGECRASDIVADDSSMSWKLHCAQGGGSLEGTSHFTSTGDRFEGSNKMSMSAQGMNFEFESTHTGKRVGDCP